MMRPSHAFTSLLRSSRLIFSSSSPPLHLVSNQKSSLSSFPPPLPLPTTRSFHGIRRSGKGVERGGAQVRRRLGGVRAAQVNESGSVDSPMMRSMETKIKEELSADTVTVKDAYGDGRHVSIYVVSSAFEGQSAVNRQRMVYKAIWEELQSTVHAVDQMITRTPDEAAKSQ